MLFASSRHAISKAEFIVLAAMMFAGIALSTDAMLPAYPEMAADLTPQAVNSVQLVLSIFVLGMGIGTFFTGPLSDSFGRKPVILAGAVLYIAASAVCAYAQSLEVLLAARFVQGLGAAGPRVVTLAVIRDLYAGPQMARLMSFVMIVFTLVPALAPTIGAFIVMISDWRGIFVLFMVYAVIYTLWMTVRLPETLPSEQRRPFRIKPVLAAVREVITHPVVRLCIVAQALCFAMLFSLLSTTQQIFDTTFGRADSFHLWFGAIAVAAASSGFVNAALVVRVGMLPLIRVMLRVQVCASTAMIGLWYADLGADVTFFGFILWKTTLFYQAGMTVGNINALAMEPMGHIAGTATSALGALATVGAVALAIPVGLSFNGTPIPLAGGILLMALGALWVVRSIGRTQVWMSLNNI